MTRFGALAPLAALALAGCGPSDSGLAPGEASVSERRALEEAAEMIEERPTPAQATPNRASGEETADEQ